MAGRSGCFSMALIAYLLTAMPKAVAQQIANVGIPVEAIAASDTPVKATPARLKMLACDQAGVAMKTLEEGERIASRIFREAGIDLEWLDGTEHSVAEADYFLRIHCCHNKLKSTLPDRTVAFAPAGGRHITVFWDRITVESKAGSHSEAMLLGYVMAHELGHLLLPPGYHAPYGIMQGRLHYEDLSQARKLGNLFFAEEEAARMQARLKAGPPDKPLSQASEKR